MNPIVIESGLDKKYIEKWDIQFKKSMRQNAEGIWRRTQQPETKALSGWASDQDARRRMIHFMDHYDVVENDAGTCNFVIDGVYLWMALTLPKAEIEAYDKKVMNAIMTNTTWVKNDDNSYVHDGITLTIERFERHPEDVKEGRSIPEDYRTITYTLISDGMKTHGRIIESPWSILRSGVRVQGTRSAEVVASTDLNEILDYLPCQAEIGGGASIELGIPPLNHLHQTYGVTNPEDKSYVFGDNDTFMVDLVTDPIRFYVERASQAYRTCLLAEPNIFYDTLKLMFDRKMVVGDVITNNFDGLLSLVGLQEKYVRRYDEPKHFPQIDFNPAARSLLVIGNHADRRKVEKQARERGLKIFFVDPEMYFDYFGNIVSYPLEEVHPEDTVFNMTAVEFAEQFLPMIEDHKLM